MDRTTFLSLLLISFPETILVTALGFLLAGIRPWWRDLFIIGALQTGSFYIFRISPIPIGYYSILAIQISLQKKGTPALA